MSLENIPSSPIAFCDFATADNNPDLHPPDPGSDLYPPGSDPDPGSDLHLPGSVILPIYIDSISGLRFNQPWQVSPNPFEQSSEFENTTNKYRVIKKADYNDVYMSYLNDKDTDSRLQTAADALESKSKEVIFSEADIRTAVQGIHDITLTRVQNIGFIEHLIYIVLWIQEEANGKLKSATVKAESDPYAATNQNRTDAKVEVVRVREKRRLSNLNLAEKGHSYGVLPVANSRKGDLEKIVIGIVHSHPPPSQKGKKQVLGMSIIKDVLDLDRKNDQAAAIDNGINNYAVIAHDRAGKKPTSVGDDALIFRVQGDGRLHPTEVLSAQQRLDPRSLHPHSTYPLITDLERQEEEEQKEIGKISSVRFGRDSLDFWSTSYYDR